jgi:hypothetical protein
MDELAAKEQNGTMARFSGSKFEKGCAINDMGHPEN